VNQPSASEVPALLGIDPSTLPLAPTDIAAAGDRQPEPCAACGAAAEVMLIATTPLGNRWIDLCNQCFRRATARR
jgi:hypothetical protein